MYDVFSMQKKHFVILQNELHTPIIEESEDKTENAAKLSIKPENYEPSASH